MTTLDHAVGRLAAGQLGLVTRAQAQAVGLSNAAVDRRVASGRWCRLQRSVYVVTGAPVTWPTKVLAACLATGGIASHRSAAALLEVDGARPGRPEVTVARGTRFAHIDARVHQSRDVHLFTARRVQGMPTTPPARLVVDLGAVVPFATLERTVGDLIGTQRLTWEDAAHALLVHSKQGRRGAGPLPALLLARYGDELDDSALERAFMRAFPIAELPMPTHQFAVYDEDGFIGRADFAYPTRRILIELDSVRWHLNLRSFQKDREKRNRMKLAGWLVLEFTREDVLRRPDHVFAQIRAALAAAGQI